MVGRSVNLWRPMAGGVMLAATMLAFATLSADEGDCCSCAVKSTATFASPLMPCLFDHPSGWKSVVGDDGAIVSAMAGPAVCNKTCPRGTPAMSASVGTTPDANAETMESIKRKIMPVVGSARCGEGTVTFYSPPGTSESDPIGGVQYYVSIGGKKYGGNAVFTCGEPGGWVWLRKLFIDSFRTNPASTFGKD